MIAAPTVDNLTLTINDQVLVNAQLEQTFDSLIANLGRLNEKPDGTPFPMTLEAWPGGRWFRDLGSNNGHLWGHVQAIKRPTLIEIYGPLFMSYPVISNLQYRLTEVDGGTLIAFHHIALGFIQGEHRTGVATGWKSTLERVRRAADSGRRG